MINFIFFVHFSWSSTNYFSLESIVTADGCISTHLISPKNPSSFECLDH